MGLLQLTNARSILESLAISFTIVMDSTKLYLFWRNMEGLKHCKLISEKLDETAKANPDEFKILLSLKKKAKYILALYFFSYSSICAIALPRLFVNSEKRLLYPAYFPFNWKANNFIYRTTFAYQWVAAVLQAYGSLVTDTFIALAMCLLTYHLRVLSMRISKIGTNPNKSERENHEDLRAAINDHKDILR